MNISNLKNIFFLLLVIFPLTSYAQLHPWRWWDNEFDTFDHTGSFCIGPYSNPCSVTTTWAAALQDAVTEYTSETDFVEGLGPNNEGKIDVWNGYLGPVNGDYAIAIPWHDDERCVDIFYSPGGEYTGNQENDNCNATTAKANKANMYYNDYYWDTRYAAIYQIFQNSANRVTAHEHGHLFGMAHKSTLYSVMYGNPKQAATEDLTSAEITWLNSQY